MNDALYALTGGALIGFASSLMLLGLGRITGISGIFAQTIVHFSKESWRYLFIIGLLVGGIMMKSFYPEFFDYQIEAPMGVVILGGFLVGLGTRIGSGCTSGHGVCGLPRKSLRSISATLIFMFFGVLTVFIKGLV